MFCTTSGENQNSTRNAETRDRTGDLQIFGLTLSQLSYRGDHAILHNAKFHPVSQAQQANSVAKPHLMRLDLSTLGPITSLRRPFFQVLRRHPHQANGAKKLHSDDLLRSAARWPRGPMDKASAYGAGDCRFESCRGHLQILRARQDCESHMRNTSFLQTHTKPNTVRYSLAG